MSQISGKWLINLYSIQGDTTMLCLIQALAFAASPPCANYTIIQDTGIVNGAKLLMYVHQQQQSAAAAAGSIYLHCWCDFFFFFSDMSVSSSFSAKFLPKQPMNAAQLVPRSLDAAHGPCMLDHAGWPEVCVQFSVLVCLYFSSTFSLSHILTRYYGSLQ